MYSAYGPTLGSVHRTCPTSMQAETLRTGVRQECGNRSVVTGVEQEWTSILHPPKTYRWHRCGRLGVNGRVAPHGYA